MTNTKEMPELKPCPFCGDKPTLTSAGDVCVIKCRDEVCRVSPDVYRDMGCHSKWAAIEDWNTRSDTPAAHLGKEDLDEAVSWLRLAKDVGQGVDIRIVIRRIDEALRIIEGRGKK